MADRQLIRPPVPLGKTFGAIVGTGLGFLSCSVWYHAQTLAQQFYLGTYFKSTLAGLEVWRRNATVRVGHNVLLSKPLHSYLEQTQYAGHSLLSVLAVPIALFLGWLMIAMIAGDRFDAKRTAAFRRGKQLRGPLMLSPLAFNRKVKGDGLSLALANKPKLHERLLGDRATTVRIQARHESEHTIIMGDPGSGKTQCFFQFADQAQWHGDAAIIYDPHREFLRRYYNPDRGDVILNPLDARCPSWCPTDELDLSDKSMAESLALAMFEGLYPGNPGHDNWFFTDGARKIAKHLVVEHQPHTSKALASWMEHADPEVDLRLLGTELEYLVEKAAEKQRTSILSTLIQPAFSFRQIPEPSESNPRWSIREWCEHRRGWIFLTNTPDTRLALRPIQSLWINLLIMRIMTMGRREDLPMTRMFLDELPTLQTLPQLTSVLTESRKAGLSVFVGFQGRSQIKKLYGEEAETIFSAPTTKILLTTKEPEAARWMSEMVGIVEVEEIRESRSDAKRTWGNKSFSTDVKQKPLVLPSEFYGFPDRTGYLRYSDYAVRITVPILPRHNVAPDFVPRKGEPAEKATVMTPQEYKAYRLVQRNAVLMQDIGIDSDNLPPVPTESGVRPAPAIKSGGKA